MGETLTLVLLVLFAAISLWMFAMLLGSMRALRREIAGLNKRLDQVDRALAAERERVDRIAELAADQPSPMARALPEVLTAVTAVKASGWPATIGLVASKLLAAYLKHRRS